MNRKDFFRVSLPSVLLLGKGKFSKAESRFALSLPQTEPLLRFVVASDGHYGYQGSPYEAYYAAFTSEVNKLHAIKPFDFCMINGDIIHDDKKYLSPAKKALDTLSLRYYVSQGNHDHASPEEWKSTWGMPVNFDFSIQENSFLVGTTSNEKGTYLCPDLEWMGRALEKHKSQKNIFIFLHINPAKLTRYAVDCPQLFPLLNRYQNVRAVFNGHDHDEDGIKIRQGIPFVFDAHFGGGGGWGTPYTGFRIVELFDNDTIATHIHTPFGLLNKASL